MFKIICPNCESGKCVVTPNDNQVLVFRCEVCETEKEVDIH